MQQVITEQHWRWINGELRLLWQRATWWHGPFAHAKGEAAQQIVDTGPYKPQIPYINQLFSEAGRLYDQGPPQFFPGSTVAAPPTSLTGSQNDILSYVQGGAQRAGAGADTALDAAQSAGGNTVRNTAAPLQDDLQGGLMALLSGQNPSLAFGSTYAPAAGTALTRALSAPNGGLNTQGAPTNPVGEFDIGAEIQSSLSGGALNPFLGDVVQAATRSADRQFQDTVIPGVRDAANAAGQRGGSSEGIARGIAGSRHDENVSDIVTQLFSQAFGAGAQERQNAMGLVSQAAAQNPELALASAAINERTRGAQAGEGLTAAQQILQQLQSGTGAAVQGVSSGTAQAGNLLQSGEQLRADEMYRMLGLLPALNQSGLAQLGAGNTIGLQQYGIDQAQTDDAVQRFFFEQYAPYANLAQFQNFIGGGYGGSVQ